MIRSWHTRVVKITGSKLKLLPRSDPICGRWMHPNQLLAVKMSFLCLLWF